jgi:hypothetical protein
MFPEHRAKALTVVSAGVIGFMASFAVSVPVRAETSVHRLERKLHKLEKLSGEVFRIAGEAALQGPSTIDGIGRNSGGDCSLDGGDGIHFYKSATPASPAGSPRKSN